MTAQAGTRKPVEPHLDVTLPSAPFIQVSPLERWLFLDRWGLFAAVIDGCTADTESVRYLLDSHLPEGIIHCDLRAGQSADPGVADEHGSVTHGQAVAATSKVFTHGVAHDLAGCGVRSPDVPVSSSFRYAVIPSLQAGSQHWRHILFLWFKSGQNNNRTPPGSGSLSAQTTLPYLGCPSPAGSARTHAQPGLFPYIGKRLQGRGPPLQTCGSI